MHLRSALVFALLGILAMIALVNSAVLAGGERPTKLASADAALVLVGDGAASASMLADRAEKALGLYQAGRVRRILVSGASYDHSNAIQRWLVACGVPTSAIALDPGDADTFSSLWRARHVFGVKTVVVVSQRFHLPRAIMLARHVGLVVDGEAADLRTPRPTLWFELREILSRTKAGFDVAVDRGSLS
jgi:SanA protein